MVDTTRFIAHPPGTQDPDTYRQFLELQSYLTNLEQRLAPLYGSANINPLVLTDAYQELTLTDDTSLPDDLATYTMGMRLSVTGSNANAEVQLKVTWDHEGGGEIEGHVVDIGNNALESVTLTGSARAGTGIKFWVRGISSEILAGVVTIARIGIGP